MHLGQSLQNVEFNFSARDLGEEVRDLNVQANKLILDLRKDRLEVVSLLAHLRQLTPKKINICGLSANPSSEMLAVVGDCHPIPVGGLK